MLNETFEATTTAVIIDRLRVHFSFIGLLSESIDMSEREQSGVAI
jgi:hypothetical protein